MEKKKSYAKIAVWTILVWTLSFACYLPTLLEKNGANIPEALTAVKYLFVIVPLAVSAIFAAGHGEFKKWLRGLFAERITLKPILFCFVTGAVGLAFSFAYSLISDNPDLFAENYPTFLSVITGSAYLFITALAEESAWRGFLLNKLSDNCKTSFAPICTGIIWAVWHIPMWTIRNSLGAAETAAYFVWTVLLSLILGRFYLKCKNVILNALLHMLFNTCFIAPVKYNVILIGCAVAAALIIDKISGKTKCGPS